MSRHLHVVDTTTGEVQAGCASCDALKDQLAGANKDIAAWRSRFALLNREKDAAAHKHEHWPAIEDLFMRVWAVECNHPNSKFTPNDFWLALPFFEKHGRELCVCAIYGAAFDAFTTRRKNGSTKRHDDWTLIFRDRQKFEDFCNRAPRESAAGAGTIVKPAGEVSASSAAGEPAGSPALQLEWPGSACDAPGPAPGEAPDAA